MENSRKSEIGAASDWIAKLQEPPRVEELSPLAQRLVFSLRVIAVFHKARRDPLAELTARLGSMTIAVKALQLVDVLIREWPEPVKVRRCCCQIASHDELTAALALEAVAANDHRSFENQLGDLLPHNARGAVWAAASELVAAEYA